MRLHELKYIPKKDSKTIQSLEIDELYDYYDFLHNKLTRLGYNKLGDGTFGIAYEIPGKEYILKVYPLSDQGFATWVKLSQQNSTNPYMPKFYGKPIQVGDLCAIRMERLSRCREVTLSEIVACMGGTFPVFKDCLEKWKEKPSVGELKEYLKTAPIVGWYKNIFIKNVMQYYDEPRAAGFWGVCEIIFRSGMLCDVHEENIMLRGNQFVISDGLAGFPNDVMAKT